MTIVSEFENATFSCTPLSGVANYTVEKQEFGSTTFSVIGPDDPSLEREKDYENNREVFTYMNVTREDNGAKLRCNLGGVISNEAPLNVLCKLFSECSISNSLEYYDLACELESPSVFCLTKCRLVLCDSSEDGVKSSNSSAVQLCGKV